MMKMTYEIMNHPGMVSGFLSGATIIQDSEDCQKVLQQQPDEKMECANE